MCDERLRMNRLTCYLFCLGAPILGIAGAIAVAGAVATVWPSTQRFNLGGFTIDVVEELALISCASLLLIGFWLQRRAGSKLQLLCGLVGPVVWFNLWAYMLREIDYKMGVRLSQPIDYAMGLGPLLGTILGYACSAFTRRRGDRQPHHLEP
jgi:hypothetical protein